MLMQILIVLLVVALVTAFWRGLRADGEPRRPRSWLTYALMAAAIVIFLLVVTGRLPVMAMLAAIVLPLLKQWPQWLPWLVRTWQRRTLGDRVTGDAEGVHRRRAAAPAGGRMSVEEAMAVLGLSGAVNRQAVIDAHRRLMQKVHPDRGGSDYLAARINEARDRLLEDLGD